MPYDHEQCRCGQTPRSYRKLKWAVLTFHSRFPGHALIYQPSTVFTDSQCFLGDRTWIKCNNIFKQIPLSGIHYQLQIKLFFFSCKFQLWTRIMEGMKFVFISDSSQKMNIQESIYSLPLLYSWNNKLNF